MEDPLKCFVRLLFFSGWHSVESSILLIQHLLKLSLISAQYYLSLDIEFLKFLRVVHLLGIDLFVSSDDCLPNHLVLLLQIKSQPVVIFHTPQTFLNLDTIIKFPFNQHLASCLHLNEDFRVSEFHVEILGCDSFRERNLNSQI